MTVLITHADYYYYAAPRAQILKLSYCVIYIQTLRFHILIHSDSQTRRLLDSQTLRLFRLSDSQTLRFSDSQTLRLADSQTLRLPDS